MTNRVLQSANTSKEREETTIFKLKREKYLNQMLATSQESDPFQKTNFGLKSSKGADTRSRSRNISKTPNPT